MCRSSESGATGTSGGPFAAATGAAPDGSSSGAGAPLADRRCVRVVVEPDRDAEPLLHPVAQRSLHKWNVHALDDDAARLVDRRRDSEADCSDRLVQQCGHGRLELGDHALLRILGRRALVPADDAPVAGDDTGQDLRAAEVDPDRMPRLHS